MTLLGKSAERLLLTAACAVGLGLGLRLPWLLADAPVLLARHGFDDLFYFTQPTTSSPCPWAATGTGAPSAPPIRQPKVATPEKRIPLERIRVGLMALPPPC